MNWTGGRLNRHARLDNNVQLKAQKQHFAKASLNFYNLNSVQEKQKSSATDLRTAQNLKSETCTLPESYRGTKHLETLRLSGKTF